MTITQATLMDVPAIAPIFNAYRMFYEQPSNISGAIKFLSDRITTNESLFFFAQSENQSVVGFTQLYPIFSSVTLERMYVLNDLFVIPTARGRGVGTQLIDHAKERCRKEHTKGLVLQTARNNPAQKLYEHLGFLHDADLHYFWATE